MFKNKKKKVPELRCQLDGQTILHHLHAKCAPKPGEPGRIII